MTLYVQTSEGFIPATSKQVVREALSVTMADIKRGPALLDPRTVIDFLMVRFSAIQHEVFSVIYVDNRHRVIKFEELFRGTIDGANVHPREVVKGALLNNAAALILAHNHPSGVAEPSRADELITARLKEALSLIDVRILDHVIVGYPFTYSFAEHGMI